MDVRQHLRPTRGRRLRWIRRRQMGVRIAPTDESPAPINAAPCPFVGCRQSAVASWARREKSGNCSRMCMELRSYLGEDGRARRRANARTQGWCTSRAAEPSGAASELDRTRIGRFALVRRVVHSAQRAGAACAAGHSNPTIFMGWRCKTQGNALCRKGWECRSIRCCKC